MTAAEIHSSLLTTNNRDYVNDPLCSHEYDQYTSCERYHKTLETQHAKIYCYNAFDELVIHLQATIMTSLPYINYPSHRVLSMILTGTQLSQAKDLVLNKTINLSILCTKYLHTLLSIFDMKELKQDNKDYTIIFNQELNNLYERLFLIFKFLEPTGGKRGRRKKQADKLKSVAISINSSTLEDSDEDVQHKTTSMNNDRIESLFEVSTSEMSLDSSLLYGLPHLEEVEKNIWSYIVHTFKLSSKLCDVETLDTFLLYKEASNRWLEFIKILLRFLKLDLSRKSDAAETLLGQNLLKICRCPSFKEASTYQLTDILLTLSSYVFTNLNTTLERTTILPIDLTLINPSHICSALNLFDEGHPAKIVDIESIPTRFELLQLVWNTCQLLHLPSIVKFKFINSVAVHMNNLSPTELATYYQCSPEAMLDSILFPVSFEIMRLMFKAWTVTSDNYFTDLSCYVQQIEKMLQFIQITDMDGTQAGLRVASDINTDAKKFAVVVKFQLLAVMTTPSFSEKELMLLKKLVISIENKEVPLALLLNV